MTSFLDLSDLHKIVSERILRRQQEPLTPLPSSDRKLSPDALKISAMLCASLRDPMSSNSLCALAIEAAAKSDLLTESRPDIMAKDANEVQILRAIVSFLTFPRSDRELRALMQKLETCRCNLRDPRIALLHHHKDTLSSDTIRTVGELCQLLAILLNTLPSGTFRKTRKNKAADAQPWPSSQSDIIPTPGGAKTTIAALLAWASVPSTQSFAVFPLLASLARFWEPLARELFRTPKAFSLATDHLQWALDHYDPREKDIVKNFILPVLMCTDGFFFPLVAKDPDATVEALSHVFAQMAQITVEIRPILKALGPIADGADPWFIRVEALQNAQTLPHSIPRLGPDTFVVVWGEVVYIRNINQCMHLECPNPLGRKLSACKRCGVMSYCDVKCQRPAWRASIFPHKTVCDLLHALRKALNLENDAEWDSWIFRPKDKVFAPNKEIPDLDEMCKAKHVSEELCALIGDEVFGLTAAKRAQLDEQEKKEQRQ
ncbi:hypothetical protein C8F04DRAFT_1116548 [Mycena alexandri]|uniref:MYND-type domain-containing protein n=1 Tax=Mycena alexandri TaxID=1745969 RepID=A0AAD6SKI3_9AGAR|nr:hypothetical protein C8F04DRAFT_1116548 [Mycena alexandri]